MRLIKYLMILIAVICFFLLLLQENRSFYYNSDKTKCVTIWKRFGGKCLVIPRKYIGLFKPDEEYLETTNRNSLTIIWEKGGEYDLVIFNSYGFKIDSNFKKTRVNYYEPNRRDEFNRVYYNNHHIKPQFEYLMVDIGEGWGIVNGKKM